MNPGIQHLVDIHQADLQRLCVRLSVRELRLFGSAVTARYDPARSDVDIVADFHQSEAPGIADRYMDLIDGLEGIFGRPVDVITRPAIKNPLFRRVIEQTSEPLYAE